MNTQEKISQQVKDHKIMLYMKGTPDFPQCGFSAKVTHMLQNCHAEFKSVNVLEDPEIRQGIKDYANWPTIPQLYIRGEFIGGCDIVTELFEKGELQKLLAQ